MELTLEEMDQETVEYLPPREVMCCFYPCCEPCCEVSLELCVRVCL
jgi:hypothetical protein